VIRQPSTFAQLHRWWLNAIAGRDVERHDGLPECGLYRMKLVSGGPWVPVEVKVVREIDPDTGELTGPEKYVAICEGRTRDPGPIWDRMEPISRADFDSLVARIAGDERLQASMVRLDLSATPTRPPKGTRR
jgi:hypothetical protein